MPLTLPLSKFTYEVFLDTLNHQESLHIKKSLSEFVQSFNESCASEPPIGDEISSSESLSFSNKIDSADVILNTESCDQRQARRGKMFLKFLESFVIVLSQDPFWSLITQDGTHVSEESAEMAAFYEALFFHLETLLVPQIFRLFVSKHKAFNLFVPNKSEDWKLVQITNQFEYILPSHLDIPYSSSTLLPLVEFISEKYTELSFEKIPSIKLAHFLICCDAIFNFLEESKKMDSASIPTTSKVESNTTATGNSLSNSSAKNEQHSNVDDFLPILIYSIIKSNPPQLSSNLNMMLSCCREVKQFGSPAAFFLTNTQVALEFIKNLKTEKLSKAINEEPSPQFVWSPLKLQANQQKSDSQQGYTLFPGVTSGLKGKLNSVAGKVVELKARVSGKTMDFLRTNSPLLSRIGIEDPFLSKTTQSKSSKSGDVTKVDLGSASPTDIASQSQTPNAAQNTSAPTNIHNSNISTKDVEIANLETKMSEKYKFFEKNETDLSLDEIRELLNEYRTLATFHSQHSVQKS